MTDGLKPKKGEKRGKKKGNGEKEKEKTRIYRGMDISRGWRRETKVTVR